MSTDLIGDVQPLTRIEFNKAIVRRFLHVYTQESVDKAMPFLLEDAAWSFPAKSQMRARFDKESARGEVLEAAVWLIRRDARLALCGAISGYDNLRSLARSTSYFNLVPQRASMTGFIVFDFANRYAEARTALARWHARGFFKARKHIESGLDRFPKIFRMLFRGANHGKLLLAVDPN